jgi:hypothetical protein
MCQEGLQVHLSSFPTKRQSPRLLFAFTDVLCLIAGAQSAVAQSWYSSTWTSRRTIKIDSNAAACGLGASLTYFPNTGGSADFIAWVRLPAFRHDADTVIYMSYGNLTVASQPQTEEVRDDRFSGVWHLGEDGTASEYQDSTRNNNTGIAGLVNSSDAPVRSATSIAGYSQDFRVDATDYYIKITGRMGEPKDLTIRGWVDLDAA